MSNTEGVILLQVADLVIEELVHKKKFPKSLRLSDLITKYGGEVDHAKGLQVLFILQSPNQNNHFVKPLIWKWWKTILLSTLRNV